MSRRMRGFTLLEMSIVLLIMATVMAGGAAIFSASLIQQQTDETKFKLAAIQKALLDYRRAYNRIPCPANWTYNSTDQYFGVEAATPGTCYGGTPTSNYQSATFVHGGVPTKTLQLPDEYAFDGWGRRFKYVVDIGFTANDGFSTITMSDAVARITIGNIATAGAGRMFMTTSAAYAIVSFGPNGHGGMPRKVVIGVTMPVNAGSVNVDELENCYCNSTGASLGFNAFYVQHPSSVDPTNPLNSFDDIVVYGTRQSLRSLTE